MRRNVARLDASRREDFFAVHCERNHLGWCRCVAWWVPTWDGWGERSAQENLRLRESLWERGEYDGYLLYVDGAPAGWCQVGERDRLEKLLAQYGLPPAPNTWAVTCLAIAPAFRRQGHARFLLSDVLQDLSARGVRRVEAFPKRGEGLGPGDLWTGPEELYRATGFVVDREDATRPVLTLELG